MPYKKSEVVPIAGVGCFTAVRHALRSCMSPEQDDQFCSSTTIDGMPVQSLLTVDVLDRDGHIKLQRELSIIQESPDEASIFSVANAVPSASNVPYMVPAEELFYFFNNSQSSSDPTAGVSTNPTLRNAVGLSCVASNCTH